MRCPCIKRRKASLRRIQISQTSLAARGTLGINLLTATIGVTGRKDGSTHHQSLGTKKRKETSLQIGVMDPTTATKVGDSRATPRGKELEVSLCAAAMARLSHAIKEENRVFHFVPHPEIKAMHLAEGGAQKGLITTGTETIDTVLVHMAHVQETDLALATGIHLLEAMESFP